VAEHPRRAAFNAAGAISLLGGAALLYSPELPRHLLTWMAKQDNLPLTAAARQRD